MSKVKMAYRITLPIPTKASTWSLQEQWSGAVPVSPC